MDSYLLIIPLIGLLAVLLVVNKRQKQSKQTAEAPIKGGSKTSVAKKPATTTKTATPAPTPKPDAQQSQTVAVEDLGWDVQAESAMVSVQEVDNLTEYKVYKQFGYHQKAAESLAQYLQNSPASEGARTALIKELASLWLQAKQPDSLAEVITQYRDSLTKHDAEDLIKAGLEIDNNHLNLRVLAEELLGWGVQKTAQELGLNENGLEPEPKSAPAVSTQRPTQAQPAAKTTNVDNIRHPLVSGGGDQWQIDQDERDVLLGFAKPEQGYRLLKDQLVYDAAIRCLNKAIQQADKPAGLIIDALALDYRHNKVSVFAQHLWRLYYSLGQYGHRVKERMLGWGYNLGQHPMFEELATNPGEQRLREIGLSHGYLTRSSSAMKAKRLPLVDSSPNEDFVTDNPSERVLSEAESLLTYGQLDHAMALLENAILEHPQESQLYIALFDLYERAEDWPRLEAMLHRIRDTIKTPPEEVVLAMSQLLQRIHHGGVQR